MAEELDKKKVTALSELTTTSDNDLYITGEGGQAPLRKISFGTIAAGILNKLSTWTFNALNTTTKTLTGAINELNSRLVTMPMPLISGLTTEELINTAYNDAHSNTTNQTHYRRLLDHGMAHSILGGGRYLLEGYRENATYGWQIAISYAIGTSTQPNRCFERSLINGAWSTWTKRPTRTEVDTLNSKTTASITAASGITFIGQVLVKRGHVVMCRLWLSGSQLTNNDYTVVGTVPSGFEPVSEVTPPVVLSATDGTLGYARLVQNGTLSIYKYGTSTVTMYVYFVYVTN